MHEMVGEEIMFAFLKDGQQRANLDSMQRFTYELREIMTQKTAGQRKDKRKHVSWDRLRTATWCLAMEAMSLVLDPRFEEFKEFFKEEK